MPLTPTRKLQPSLVVEFSRDCSFKARASHLGRQATVVARAWQWREAQTWLVPGEGVGRLEERRGMPEGAEPSLLGEQLLVGHWVDGVRERKGGAARNERERVRTCMFWFFIVKMKQRWFVLMFGDLRRDKTTWCFAPVSPPEASDQVSVRAAGRWAGARVVDVGNQRVWWGAYHRLKVDTCVWQWRNWQSPFPAQSGCHSGAGEAWHCRTDNKEVFGYIPGLCWFWQCRYYSKYLFWMWQKWWTALILHPDNTSLQI